MKCIIKRKGHQENFDERKLYASIYSAARISGLKEKESERIASKIVTSITSLIKGKGCVTSDSIFREAIKNLKKINKEIAFMYETHRDIS
jgi:transcriptional regulator NrdR family protein